MSDGKNAGSKLPAAIEPSGRFKPVLIECLALGIACNLACRNNIPSVAIKSGVRIRTVNAASAFESAIRYD